MYDLKLQNINLNLTTAFESNQAAILQSISVLVQYKEYLIAFESNQAAIHSLPTTLLSAFDNRSWIPVTNILIRLCKGCGFGLSKHEESSSNSGVFQVTFSNELRLN